VRLVVLGKIGVPEFPRSVVASVLWPNPFRIVLLVPIDVETKKRKELVTVQTTNRN
jgi:hypothetical protein